GIESDVDATGVFIFIKNFLPCLAAVGGAKDAALGIRTVRMTQGGYKNDIRIFGIDDDPADGAAVMQPDVLPRLASVERLVNSISVRNVPTDAGFPRAHVN